MPLASRERRIAEARLPCQSGNLRNLRNLRILLRCSLRSRLAMTLPCLSIASTTPDVNIALTGRWSAELRQMSQASRCGCQRKPELRQCIAMRVAVRCDPA
jgi:hypothetical protein